LKIKKRPCPYCQKKLQAPTKHKWRINLAQHLSRTCQAWQREQLGLTMRIILEHLQKYFPNDAASWTLPGFGLDQQLAPSGYPAAACKKAEVESLERLFQK
jgi:hypothetical protein